MDTNKEKWNAAHGESAGIAYSSLPRHCFAALAFAP